MYHSMKRKRPRNGAAAGASGEGKGEVSCCIDVLEDMLPNILSYLKLKEMMCTRRVSRTWTEAVRKTSVSPEEMADVSNVKSYNAVSVMSTVLPNLQSVKIASFGGDSNHRKYSDGEDPDEERAAQTTNLRTHDIGIFANFRKLRRLEVDYPDMNGRYPFLFNFPLLQKLSITSDMIKWDLGMLTGLPLLRELECCGYKKLTGNISRLRALKDTLEKVTFGYCLSVEGNFMDLADFPRLKKLNLNRSAVTVDIGNIGSGDFSELEELWIEEPMPYELGVQRTSNGSLSGSVTGNIRSLRVLKDTLQTFTFCNCPNVEGNFMALSDFPQLRVLHLDRTAVTVDIGDLSNGDFASLAELVYTGFDIGIVRGNIRNLRVLKDTLENVTLTHSNDVEGNIMDLADFPRLRALNLEGTAVTGDIRDIGADDFSKLEDLFLPSTVYGGQDYELQRISDAPELIRALCLLKKHHPSLTLKDWAGELSADSPDWYDWDEMDEDCVSPPFAICLVEAGTRIGYRWRDNFGEEYCEVNWLDPLPDEESSDYVEFLNDLQQIENEGGDFYKGYHQPPTQEEYNRLVEEERRHEREIGAPFS